MGHRIMELLHKEIILIAFAFLFTLTNATRIKRMYALCPPHFSRIGNECYYVSPNQVNWLDAHFECKERNGRLAEPEKVADARLRKYLQHYDTNRTEKWIGGIYNWERFKWQWGYNGRDVTYQSFSQMMPGSSQNLKFHCAVLNPQLKYRWSARSCADKHQFVCQHRMPYVTQKNRIHVYRKWNETYPNEMANEVEDIINQDERGRNYRQNYRRAGEQPRNHQKRPDVPANDQPNLKRNMTHRNRTDRFRNPGQLPRNRIRQRTPRKPVNSNDVLSNNNQIDKQIMTNDVPLNPIVEYAQDPNIMIRNTRPTNQTEVKKLRKRKRPLKDGHRQRKRPMPTTPSPIDNSTKATQKITKEEMRMKEEERQRWEKEQIRLRETKKLLDEKIALTAKEAEMKRRQEEEIERQTEMFNREHKEIVANRKREDDLRSVDEVRRAQEMRKQEEVQRREETKAELLKIEQEKVRRQEEKNQQIEERIRQEEERKRQEKLARHQHGGIQKTEAPVLIADRINTKSNEEKPIDENLYQEEERTKIKDPRIEKKRKEEDDRIRREKLRQRLQKLKPDGLRNFFAMRAERNKKKAEGTEDNNIAIPY